MCRELPVAAQMGQQLHNLILMTVMIEKYRFLAHS